MSPTCFSYTSNRNKCYQFSFHRSGLKSTTTILDSGSTTIHCWIPKNPFPTKPNLLLIHGFGANAMWQWDPFITTLSRKFNLYIPDLIFFGESFTTLPDRSEHFQARSLMAVMEKFGVEKMSVAGISYGGFVAYSLAAEFGAERVEKVVICCSGVCLEEKDMRDGMFKVSSADEAGEILVAQTPRKLKELIKLSFYKPAKHVPSCFLQDFIYVMNTEYVEEKKQLVVALQKDRKLTDLPKITQPTLIIWGEHDQVFPLELAFRLKRHLGDNAELAIIKKAGHAINMEKPKQFRRHLKRFLCNNSPPPQIPHKNEHPNQVNGVVV